MIEGIQTAVMGEEKCSRLGWNIFVPFSLFDRGRWHQKFSRQSALWILSPLEKERGKKGGVGRLKRGGGGKKVGKEEKKGKKGKKGQGRGRGKKKLHLITQSGNYSVFMAWFQT